MLLIWGTIGGSFVFDSADVKCASNPLMLALESTVFTQVNSIGILSACYKEIT